MLSTTSEYAIRALCHLACLGDGETILGRELSATTHIPGNYLAKILLALNKSGIVEAKRGPWGGYRLHKPAADITLLEVATIIEGDGVIPNCLLQHSHICSDDHPCSAHSDWKVVREAFASFLENTTIARITSGGFELTTKPK